MDQDRPVPGQIWLNTRKQRRYVVSQVGNQPDPIITYMPLSPEGPGDGPYERPLSEWFGLNRDGQVRFTRVRG